MSRPLTEMRDVAGKFEVPLIYAGDIFDRWNAGPELINWAIENLPHGFAVPGQHDLPLHNYEDIQKSAYWTLKEAGKITNLLPGDFYEANHKLYLTGFPWGSELYGRDDSGDKRVVLGVVHRYCWRPKFSDIPNADIHESCHKYQHVMQGFTSLVFGDNHIGFLSKDRHLMNCGSLMRRRIDQRDYAPMIGLLLKNGTFAPYYLDTSNDVFTEELAAESETILAGMQDFLEDLGGLASSGVDFVTTLRKALKQSGLGDGVRKLVTKTIEEVLQKQEKK